MNIIQLPRHFRRIGARVEVRVVDQDSRSIRNRNGMAVDIGQDSSGEFFDIQFARNASPEIEVLQVAPKLKHLLLMSRSIEDGSKNKLLCGHDERHWFVAAVPELGGVGTVTAAMEALKPRFVAALQTRLEVPTSLRNRRRNAAFTRQGEWFFVPAPDAVVDMNLVLRNERLSRGRGKPHFVDELFRTGGEMVYVSHDYPMGLDARQHRRLLSKNPEARHAHWVVQRRNPQVLVRGRVRHADHATICLKDWHQVLMNTESQAKGAQQVAFLD